MAQSVGCVDNDLAVISIQDGIRRSEAPNIQIIQYMSIEAEERKARLGLK